MRFLRGAVGGRTWVGVGWGGDVPRPAFPVPKTELRQPPGAGGRDAASKRSVPVSPGHPRAPLASERTVTPHRDDVPGANQAPAP